MKNLPHLIYLLEITRGMPQYGYALSGGNARLGNLAEHHYLVTMIAWQIARDVKKGGADIDVLRVIEFALIHDIGELFGSDISMPYALANPGAKEKAKEFEYENLKFLETFFDDEPYQDLSEEILDAKSDEALIAKIADYMEITVYKQYTDRFSQKDINMIRAKIDEKVNNISDDVARDKIKLLLSRWFSELKNFSTFDEKIKDILNSS